MRSTRLQAAALAAQDRATLSLALGESPSHDRATHSLALLAEACSPGALQQTLSLHGFALVKAVVSEAECASLTESIKAFVCSLGYPCGFGDAAAEADESRWPLGCPGIFGAFGVGHCSAAWQARLHPNVRAVFAALYDTPQLVTSFDAVCAERPSKHTRSPFFRLHTDQNPTTAAGSGFDAVQGVLSLTATEANGPGTSLVPGSHLLHRQLLCDPPTGPTPELESMPALNYHELSEEQKSWLLKRAEVLHVTTAPGDLLLFDSRTIHCGRSSRTPLSPWRFALFVCMWPASRLSQEDRARKRRAMGLDGAPRCETTNHWPDGREFMPRFGWPDAGSNEDAWARERPAGAANDGVCTIPPIALTREGLRLAGAELYDRCDRRA